MRCTSSPGPASNAALAGSAFRNLSRPPGAHHAPLTVTFAQADPPHAVIDLLIDVASSLPWRALQEQPSASYLGGGRYTVSLPLLGPADVERASSLYLSWLWYAARRRGLALDTDRTNPAAEPEQRQQAVRLVAQTLQLREAELETLDSTAATETYASGEVVQAGGVVPDRLLFVVSGRLRVTAEAGGDAITVAEIETGDYVGQSALTREPADSVVTAVGVTTLLAVPLSTVEHLMRARPALASELGRTIERRRALLAAAAEAAAITTPGGHP